MLSKPTLTTADTSSRFHRYLHSPQKLERIMFWRDRFYSTIFFSCACLKCLVCNTVSLSSEFSFQPHPSNGYNPTNPCLYTFILMSLDCNYYWRFSIVPIYSDIAPEVLIWFSLFRWFLFLISCSSYNLSLLPSSICCLYWLWIPSLLLGLLIHSHQNNS